MGIGEEPCEALTTYALPINKISQRMEFYAKDNLMPILSYLFYDIMEFKGKNYIVLWSKRFDKTFAYPASRIYLLEGDKRELKCTF